MLVKLPFVIPNKMISMEEILQYLSCFLIPFLDISKNASIHQGALMSPHLNLSNRIEK